MVCKWSANRPKRQVLTGNILETPGKTHGKKTHGTPLWAQPMPRSQQCDSTMGVTMRAPAWSQLDDRCVSAGILSSYASFFAVRKMTVNQRHIYGFFQKWRYPNSWLVYEGTSHLEMDDDWGYPYFRKPTYTNNSVHHSYTIMTISDNQW